MTKRTSLFAIAPDRDLMVAGQLCLGDLSTQSRRRFLASSLPGSERAKDIMKTHDARLNAVVFPVMQAQALCDQFLPAIGILWQGRISIFLFKWCHIGVHLLELRVDTSRTRVEVASNIVLTSRIQRMYVD